VEVIVLEVTERRHKKTGEPETRITLSLKALEADPFDRVDELAPAGAVIEGTVRKLMDFGAFIEIAPGLEGLLHVSELGAGAHHPSSYLSVGQPLLVTVQSVDPERKRVSLAPAPKGAQAGTRISQAGPRKGEIVKCTVDRVERYGVFVQVEGVPGRAGRGLIPERETGTAQGTDLKRAFPQGKELQAKVLETGKLKLSIKAVKEDEDRKVFEDYKKKQGGAGMGTLGDLLSGLKK
ncbi:MAG TPA: S1 RNA-binding domain-containing protein, partial [Polyangiaceae bacterium LLY-WYZ-15_(1-7)]|nr:S1 RNA-binding domain-containing protein [Polyangiaceae bacterium LLY-WYZ-15_(1-7)]